MSQHDPLSGWLETKRSAAEVPDPVPAGFGYQRQKIRGSRTEMDRGYSRFAELIEKRLRVREHTLAIEVGAQHPAP